jgi:transcriptional regulator
VQGDLSPCSTRAGLGFMNRPSVGIASQMYRPPAFREDRPEVLHGLIRQYPLGALITQGAEGLEANHIPWWLEVADSGEVRLLGHIARANPLGKSPSTRPEVLVLFQGPAHYISPGWYPTKRDHGRVVPTWNYVVVHAHGRLVFHPEPAWIRAQLERLTNQLEATQPEPWSVGDAPPEYIDALLQSVVGVEIRVDRLEGKWKISQNQPEVNREGVIRNLENKPDQTAQELARLMRDAGTET